MTANNTTPVDTTVQPAENAALRAAFTEAVASELVGKKFYASKTFWANIIAGLAVVAQLRYGFIIDLEYQTLALSVINLALRKVTTTPVIW
jgi:hypothetical protein